MTDRLGERRGRRDLGGSGARDFGPDGAKNTAWFRHAGRVFRGQLDADRSVGGVAKTRDGVQLDLRGVGVRGPRGRETRALRAVNMSNARAL